MKRILSWVLALVLLLGYMPTGAVQAQSLTETVQLQPAQETTAPEQTQLLPVYTAVSADAVDTVSLDNAQLLEGYAYSLFYGQVATYGRKAGDRLTGDEKLIYDALVPIIKQIAAGERASTVIGLGQTVSTGSAQYAADAQLTFTGKSLNDDALQRILSALLTDLPYDLYWYDKVTGARSISLAPPDGIMVHFQLSLAVAKNYRGSGEYTVNGSQARAAVTAAKKSGDIISKYAAVSDYEKLLGYKEEICSLVTYDYSAANTGNFSQDNDPWQLIYVFDGDTATNVVCEGYSKAFMYLCQQTAFAGDVSCITVSGIMGGPHMWNIVTLEGKNYLVDVTNSEPGTVGADGSLFMAGGSGSVLGGYTVGGKNYSYIDKAGETDPDIILWGSDADSVLTLAAENYTPGKSNILASGTCGDNLTWTLDDAGTLTISGTGAMDDYGGDAPWYAWRNDIKAVSIPDGVTTIGLEAFSGCTSLTSVTIPDSVTSIGVDAFYSCTSLTSVTIPDGVTSIGEFSFQRCTSLTSVTIGNGVTSIGHSAFSGCTGLKNMYYSGKEVQWQQIEIDEENECLTNAKYIHYNCASAEGHWQKEVTAPTCTADGYTTNKCSCGYSYKDAAVKKLGHSMGNWATTKKVTCTANGTKTRKCTRTGCTHSESAAIKATGHSYDAGKVTKAATCKAAGVKTFTCKTCKATKTSAIAKLTTHTYSNNCDTTCNVCGAKRTVKHTYSNNCDAKCNVCNAKRTAPHTYSNSCDTKCNKCSAKRSIKHTYDNSCDTKCNVCKKTRKVTHTYKTITTKATLSKNGKVEKKCAVCGKVSSKTTVKYVKSIKLSATSYTYDGKTKSPSVTVKDSGGKKLKKGTDYTVTYSGGRKDVGTYSVKVTLTGKYTGEKVLTFKIDPSKTSVSKLTAGKGSITATWKKAAKMSGYELQYATAKSFSGATTVTVSGDSTTKYALKNLKAKKKYYVRVRTYKIVNGEKVYSAWSSAKNIKTK